MRPADIQDTFLRSWAEKHVEEALAECKRQKVSSELLAEIWASYGEGDWGALRNLKDLRRLAWDLGIQRSEIEIAVQRRMKRSGSPYTMGLEVAALKELTATLPERPELPVWYDDNASMTELLKRYRKYKYGTETPPHAIEAKDAGSAFQ